MSNEWPNGPVMTLTEAFPDPNAARLRIIEAALFVSPEPLQLDQLKQLFDPSESLDTATLQALLRQLQEESHTRGVQLVEVAGGWRYQSRPDFQPWLLRLQEDKPRRYGRALLETLALVAYRQPITRGEIEEVRGVAVATSVMRTLLERQWIKPVGRRDIPGRPITFGTTDTFLNDFGLQHLSELPSLAHIKSMAELDPGFDFEETSESETSFANILGAYQALDPANELDELDDDLAASWQATDAVNAAFSNQLNTFTEPPEPDSVDAQSEVITPSEWTMTEREVTDAITAKIQAQEQYLERQRAQHEKDDENDAEH